MLREDTVLANALFTLADLMHCASGDFHLLHLNYMGEEFNTMHPEVLKKYYEEADSDYDELVEKGLMFAIAAPNPNGSAIRISYQSFEGSTDYTNACLRIREVLDVVIEQMFTVYKVMNNDQCPYEVGVANFLQTRLEYWTKERAYFNDHRFYKELTDE